MSTQRLKLACLLFLFPFISSHVSAQYILNGSAQQISCNCYTITPAEFARVGSVWNANKINLSQSFDFRFDVYLGCNDVNGADGIVFMLQPLSTSIGTAGGGIGFGGVVPSIGISLDTYQNPILNDPPFDHISIQANGDPNHANDLAGPVAASAISDNIEDCNWHRFRIIWNATTKVLSAYFDDSLRVSRTIDLVASVFNGDPNVYWGFTGATGGFNNLQQFCTALNPVFSSNVSNNTACVGDILQFSSQSFSFAPITNYFWNFGDGTISNQHVPPPKQYLQPGSYPVKLEVTGQDGCKKDTTITITIGVPPNSSIRVYDTCAGLAPRLTFQPQPGVNYVWALNGTAGSNPQALINNLMPGSYQLTLESTSQGGCGQPDRDTAIFEIKSSPRVSAQYVNGCMGDQITFTGLQVDNATAISRWDWVIRNDRFSGQTTSQRFVRPGTYPILLKAQATNGCISTTDSTSLTINQAIAHAGNDTIAAIGIPFTLQGGGNGSFQWLPMGVVSNDTMAHANFIPLDDQQLILLVTTPEGCFASDTVFIRAIKGPEIYVPDAFTPNGDGLNDVFRPIAVGFKSLRRFSIYNRWGQLVFETRNSSFGWNGGSSATGTYVWVVEAITEKNQNIIRKGTVTLIR